MVQNPINSQVLKACELTQQVIQCLEKDDLESITDLENDRQSIFKLIEKADRNDLDRSSIEQLLQLNNSAEALMKQKQSSLTQQQVKIKKAQHQAAIYKNNHIS